MPPPRSRPPCAPGSPASPTVPSPRASPRASRRAGPTRPACSSAATSGWRRFAIRWPTAAGRGIRVMAVLVARRDGLHVALTRHAATTVDPDLERGLAACRTIHRGVLAACRPGAAFGDALEALAAGYAAAGARDEWRAHYQGGPIGFGQREFEIAPCQTDEPLVAGADRRRRRRGLEPEPAGRRQGRGHLPARRRRPRARDRRPAPGRSQTTAACRGPRCSRLRHDRHARPAPARRRRPARRAPARRERTPVPRRRPLPHRDPVGRGPGRARRGRGRGRAGRA